MSALRDLFLHHFKSEFSAALGKHYGTDPLAQVFKAEVTRPCDLRYVKGTEVFGMEEPGTVFVVKFSPIRKGRHNCFGYAYVTPSKVCWFIENKAPDAAIHLTPVFDRYFKGE